MNPTRFDPAICGVCAGRGVGIGYCPPPMRGRPFRPIWLCDDPQCIPIAKATYSMSQHDFDRIERMATLEAGQGLEKFCDEIGKTDFAVFSQSEFETAMRRVIEDYRGALVGKLRDEAPF